MRNISDIIEQYLKNILHTSPSGLVEIQRNDLADQFQCVPSQINYVISTRFSLEKGFVVESKRGGGGYIRIQKVDMPKQNGILEHILRTVRDQIDQESAEGLIYQLEDAEYVSAREANLLKAAISRDSLLIKLPLRDQVRAIMLKNMLISLLSR
ncbi:MAG: CtsR family transcriptional regulator [Paenibacillaceae bacterium]